VAPSLPPAALALGALLSLAILAIPLLPELPSAPWLTASWLEAVSMVAYAWSVWLLARNHPAGWWIGLVGCAGYAVFFVQIKLYAETLIQGVYFVTSLQAIWLWVRGGQGGGERPVGRVSKPWLVATVPLVILGTLGLWAGLTWLRGAAPGWDAFTTVLSLTAHVYLMGRNVESWYLWVAVDTIYVPLYASQGAYLTAGLYAVFWVMALQGLFTFRRLWREQQESAEANP
jgi:nicotinamide mononucleotide transporter